MSIPRQPQINREAVLEAFKTLRKNRVLAKANFSCCGSCAGSEIDGRLEDKPMKWDGYAYWHRQTEARAFPWVFSYDPPSLNIYYGGNEYGSDMTTEHIGSRIVAVMESHGLNVHWDGNPDNSIEIFPDGLTKADYERN